MSNRRIAAIVAPIAAALAVAWVALNLDTLAALGLSIAQGIAR